MARLDLVAGAEKLHTMIGNMNRQLRNISANIGLMQSYLAGLSTADRDAMFGVLTERGYDIAELQGFYNELVTEKGSIDTNITVFPDTSF